MKSCIIISTIFILSIFGMKESRANKDSPCPDSCVQQAREIARKEIFEFQSQLFDLFFKEADKKIGLLHRVDILHRSGGLRSQEEDEKDAEKYYLAHSPETRKTMHYSKAIQEAKSKADLEYAFNLFIHYVIKNQISQATHGLSHTYSEVHDLRQKVKSLEERIEVLEGLLSSQVRAFKKNYKKS